MTTLNRDHSRIKSINFNASSFANQSSTKNPLIQQCLRYRYPHFKIPFKLQILFGPKLTPNLCNRDQVTEVNKLDRTSVFKLPTLGASLETQWKRICWLTQKTQVWSLICDAPTYLGTTKPGRHCWSKPACPRDPTQKQAMSLPWEAWAAQLERTPCSLQLEKSQCSNKGSA